MTDWRVFLDGVACGLLLVPAAISAVAMRRFRGVLWSWRLTWRWGKDEAVPWVALQVAREPIRVAPILTTPEDAAALAAYRACALASSRTSGDEAAGASPTAGSDAARGGGG